MAVMAADLRALCEQSFVADLNEALGRLFQAADTTMVKMAVSSSDNAEQNRQFESVQGLRIARYTLQHEFTRCLMGALQAERCDMTAADEEHMNSLRHLMGVDLKAWRTNGALAASLMDLGERLSSVDHQFSNPLNPEHFVSCFLLALAQAELDINTKMLVLRLFESQLYTQLDEFVRRTNDELIDAGILPQLQTRAGSLTMSVDAIVEATLGDKGTGKQITELEEALEELQANDYEAMDDLLTADSLSDVDAPSAARDLLQEIKAEGYELTEGDEVERLQVEKMRLLGQLFGILLADESLPAEALHLLGALQLPYARIALADDAFFNDDDHPAKNLLNTITKLAEPWQPDSQALQQDPLYKQFMVVVQRFLEAERLENIPYQDLLFELLAYSESQRQKSARATQRMLDSEYGAAASEMARKDVESALSERLASSQLAESGRRILDEGWSHVLYLTALKQGVGSADWKSQLQVVDDLIASLRPAEAFASRAELLRLLQPLLRALREGLMSISMSTDIINELFSELEVVHKKLAVKIGGEGDDTALELLQKSRESVVDGAAEEGQDASEAEELEAAAAAEDNAEAEVVVSEATRQQLSRMAPGVALNWLRNEKQERCKVAAVIKHTNKYIITSRSGMKLAELHIDELGQLLESGEIEVIEAGQMFESALASVIGGMRDKR